MPRSAAVRGSSWPLFGPCVPGDRQDHEVTRCVCRGLGHVRESALRIGGPGVAFNRICGPSARGVGRRCQRRGRGTLRCPTAFAWSVRSAFSRPGIAMRWFLGIAPSFSLRSKVLTRQSAAFESSWTGGGASDGVGAAGCVTIDVLPGGIGANPPVRSSAPCQPSGVCGSRPAGPSPRDSLAIPCDRMNPPTLGDLRHAHRILPKVPEALLLQPVSHRLFPRREKTHLTDPQRVRSWLIAGPHKGWRLGGGPCYTACR